MQITHALLTGASGMIGGALIREMLSRGIRVTAIVRPGSPKNADLPKDANLTLVEADLSELRSLSDRLAGDFDAFFHLGWAGTYGDSRNDMYLQNRNVEYALDAVSLAQAAGCSVFVGAGSQAEYGRVEGLLRADTPANPEMGYGIAKLCAGQMTRIRCRELGIRHEWVRILSVYGPYDGNGTMVTSGIRKLLTGERPSYTKGEQMWDYLYSKDAAAALLAVAESGRDGAVYPLGSGHAEPLADYIRTIRDAVDQYAEIGLGEIPYGPDQVMYLCADITDLKNDTGFEPVYTFEKGIRETVEWCRSTSKS